MSTKIVRNDSDQKLIAGIAKHLKKGTTLVVAGEKYTPADIAKVLQRRIATTAQVVVAQAGWRKAVAEERDLINETHQTVSQIRQALEIMFAGSPEVLADLGIAQRKARLRSLDEKALARSKALATRLARHTMGPRAKAAVHGAVVEVSTPTPTPATAPVANNATPPAAPAAPASPAVPGPSQPLVLNGSH
jgi:hypothetical protein